MVLTISDDRQINASTIEAGYREENKAFKLEFEIPEYLSEYGKKACFRAKDGTTFAKIFDNTISNVLTFTADITQYSSLDCTIEFFKTENEEQIIAKTSMLHININNAIITDDIQEDNPQVILLNGLIENVTDAINRVNALEDTLEQAEQDRDTAEQDRATAEGKRETYINELKQDVQNGNLNGATFTPSVDAEGNLSWTNNKELPNPNTQNIRGPQGPVGPQGEAFQIKKTYPSIEAMQADFNNMQIGDYVMIANSVEIEDNAKLFTKTENAWVYITDFSGATGIQGPRGEQGIQGIQGEQGVGISNLEVRDGDLYVTLTNNTTQNAGTILTQEVKQWIVEQITENAESDFNTFYNRKVDDFEDTVDDKIAEIEALNTLHIISEEVIDL